MPWIANNTSTEVWSDALKEQVPPHTMILCTAAQATAQCTNVLTVSQATATADGVGVLASHTVDGSANDFGRSHR